MARFVYEGYDEVIRQADRAGEEMHGRVERALKLSADILIEELKRQERDTFKAPTGEMGRILEKTPELTVSSDYSQVIVYPKGDYTGIRGKPRRAATIAFVLESGRPGHLEPNPWNARADRAAKKRINGIIEQTLRGGSA
jgi:hypothetical protein